MMHDGYHGRGELRGEVSRGLRVPEHHRLEGKLGGEVLDDLGEKETDFAGLCREMSDAVLWERFLAVVGEAEYLEMLFAKKLRFPFLPYE